VKFYKRDPDAALSGMAELTLQERGAYNTIIDLLYSRDGDLRDDDDMLRRCMGCHGNEWRAVKSRLIAKRKIWVEGGFLKAKRVDDVLQEAAEFSETQRKRAGKRWETAGKQPGNAEETPSKRPGKVEKTQTNQTTDDARARMLSTPTPTPIVKRDTSVSPKKATRIPPDWHLSQAELVFAESEGLSEIEAGVEADQFRDYWRGASGQKATKMDWPATWRNWVRNAVKRRPQKRSTGNGKSSHLMRMADDIDQRAEADSQMDHGEGAGDAVSFLPARDFA